MEIYSGQLTRHQYVDHRQLHYRYWMLSFIVPIVISLRQHLRFGHELRTMAKRKRLSHGVKAPASFNVPLPSRSFHTLMRMEAQTSAPYLSGSGSDTQKGCRGKKEVKSISRLRHPEPTSPSTRDTTSLNLGHRTPGSPPPPPASSSRWGGWRLAAN